MLVKNFQSLFIFPKTTSSLAKSLVEYESRLEIIVLIYLKLNRFLHVEKNSRRQFIKCKKQ